MSSETPYEREPTSAPGDFYVENRCCVSCGVPQVVAPDLVGWENNGGSHCYWKKQPETPDEMRQASQSSMRKTPDATVMRGSILTFSGVLALRTAIMRLHL